MVLNFKINKMLFIIITLSALFVHLQSSSAQAPGADEKPFPGPDEMNKYTDSIMKSTIVELKKCDSPNSSNLFDEDEETGKIHKQNRWKPPDGLLVDTPMDSNFYLGPSKKNWCLIGTQKIVQRYNNSSQQYIGDEDLSSDVKYVANVTLFRNGTLLLYDYNGSQHFSLPEDYCVFDILGTKLGFEICRSSINSSIETAEPVDLLDSKLRSGVELQGTHEVSKASNIDNVILQKCGWYSNLPNSNSTEDEDVSATFEDTNPYNWNVPHEIDTRGYDGLDIKHILLGPSQSNWCKTKKTFKIKHSSNTETAQQEYEIKIGFPDVRFVDNITLFHNGTLTWIDIQGVRHIRNRTHFCVNDSNGRKLELEICQSPCSNEVPCVPKCCPENQVIDADKRKCIPTETYWNPTFYRDVNKKDATHRHYSLHIGLPCTRKTYLIQSNNDKIYPNLFHNGTLFLVNGNNQNKRTVIQPGEFCIDGIYESSMTSSNGNRTLVAYSGSEWDQVIIGCSRQELEIPSWIPPLYATVNHTAALFLFLTALVYLLLWSHQNIHGWLQFSYAVSLFFAFNFLAIVQIWSQEIHAASPNMCAYLGWLIHLTFLSAFFWLTSMNFDLWWRFSGNRSLRRIRSKPYRENVQRFTLFALFSLGIPLLILGCAIALDYFYRDSPHDAIIQLPRFGARKCYFEDKESQFPFLYGPVGVLLLINLIFFTSTVMHLRKIHSNTELARSHSTLEDKKGVRLIAKLFIVMGVLWVFEFISWAANVAFPKNEVVLIWVFMPTDILNSLQGIAIFVIFICKPNILSQLKVKYQWTSEINREKTLTQNTNATVTDRHNLYI